MAPQCCLGFTIDYLGQGACSPTCDRPVETYILLRDKCLKSERQRTEKKTLPRALLLSCNFTLHSLGPIKRTDCFSRIILQLPGALLQLLHAGHLLAKDLKAAHKHPVFLITLFLFLFPIFSPKELSTINSVFQGRPNPDLATDFLESPKFK